MADSAHVTSIEALEEFRAKLCNFGVDATNALSGLAMQIRRVFEWVEDQTQFWQKELRIREEEVGRAKAQLLQRQGMGGARGEGPGYTEQKIALEEALESLHQARQKLENCRHWAVTLPREVNECEGPARQLAGMLETDLRKAVALLEQKLRTLEEYVQITPGAGAGTTPGAAAAETASAPAEGGQDPSGNGAAAAPPQAEGKGL
jgi:hypothetical protein